MVESIESGYGVMLVTKEEAAKKISAALRRVLFDKEKNRQCMEYAKETYSMPTGDFGDYMAERLKVQDADGFTMFILADSLDHVNRPRLVKEIFTDVEIRELSGQRMESHKVKFPISIDVLQVNSDQWIGTCDVKFLMSLRNSQLINYNANAQRTMKRVMHQGDEFFRISINKAAVKAIRESFENGTYIPNTITLNIPENAYGYRYDANTGRLIIKDIPYFDIADGYHRYIAISQIYDANPDFNYPLEIRILHFSDDKVKQFIYQEDQKTKMRKLDSDSMNMNDPSVRIVEKLNQDWQSDLNGKISRNEGLVNFGEMMQCVTYFYTRKSTNKGAKFINETEAELRDRTNAILEGCGLLDKHLSYEQLLIIFTCIEDYDMEESVRHAKKGFDNMYKLDHKQFLMKIPRRGTINQVREICK